MKKYTHKTNLVPVMTALLSIYSHADFMLHNGGQQCPESPDRIKKVIDSLQSNLATMQSQIKWIEAPIGNRDQVMYVHDAAYYQQVHSYSECLKGSDQIHMLDEDTGMNQYSFQAAMRGVGAVCQAIDDIVLEKTQRAFCPIRPPGHHALKSQAMGFCIFGYAAIAAHHALKYETVEKVAIIDFDIHHGNGTQQLVQDNPDILFISINEEGGWPHCVSEKQNGPYNTIRNYNVRVNGPAENYFDIFENSIVKDIQEFQPDLLIVSAGFDAHKDDVSEELKILNPAYIHQNLTDEDYEKITEKIAHLSHLYCQNRVLSILEGGYNPDVLAANCLKHARILTKDIS